MTPLLGTNISYGGSTYEHFAKGWVGVEEESVLEVERRVLPIVHLVKPASYLSTFLIKSKSIVVVVVVVVAAVETHTTFFGVSSLSSRVKRPRMRRPTAIPSTW